MCKNKKSFKLFKNYCLVLKTTILQTRLHSSRMRTARALTVSPSMFCAGGCTWSRGVYLVLGAVPGLGVYLVPGGVRPRGYLVRYSSSPLWTDTRL